MQTERQPLDVVQIGNKVAEVVGREAPERPVKDAPTAQELLDRADKLGAEMRELIVQTKRLPRSVGDPHTDPSRSLALAQQYLQTGWMWLRRAIENPKVF